MTTADITVRDMKQTSGWWYGRRLVVAHPFKAEDGRSFRVGEEVLVRRKFAGLEVASVVDQEDPRRTARRIDPVRLRWPTDRSRED